MGNPSMDWATARAVTGQGQEQTRVFRVHDFGAVHGDGVDDTAASRAAFAAAREKPHAVVVFEPGVYLVEGKEPDWRVEGPISYYAPIFELNGHSDLRVLGNGAELQARNWAPIFLVSEVAGLDIRDLVIDWERDLPHTEGVVIADTSGHVDVRVNDGFNIRDGLFVTGLIHYDTANDRYELPWEFNRGAPVPAANRADLGRCAALLQAPGYRRCGVPGRGRHVVKHTEAGGPAFVIVTSSEVALRELSLRAAPGQGILACDVRNMSLLNSTIAPPPGRWMSLSRGATNFSQLSGQVLIKNCVIMGQGDDAYNFHGAFHRGVVQPDGLTAVITEPATSNMFGYFDDSHRFAYFYPGDMVEFSLPAESLVNLGSSELVAVDKSTNAGVNTYVLTLADELPPEMRDAGEAAIFNTTRMPDHAELSGCRIGRCTGGGLIAADHTLIADNEFISTAGSPARMEPGWGLNAARRRRALLANSPTIPPAAPDDRTVGTAAKEVMVRGNTFRDVLYTKAPEYADLATVYLNTTHVPSAPAGTFRHIEIFDNRFVRSGGPGGSNPAVKLNAASHVSIQNNEFVGMDNHHRVVLG